MIHVSCRLYDIVKKAFVKHFAEVGEGYDANGAFASQAVKTWADHLTKMNVQTDSVWGPGDNGVEAVMNIMAILDCEGSTSGNRGGFPPLFGEERDFVACADPSNSHERIGILIFPKTLADKTLALGYFPIPDEETK